MDKPNTSPEIPVYNTALKYIAKASLSLPTVSIVMAASSNVKAHSWFQPFMRLTYLK